MSNRQALSIAGPINISGASHHGTALVTLPAVTCDIQVDWQSQRIFSTAPHKTSYPLVE